MRLVDELDLRVCSGSGGRGIVSWLRLKFMPKGGPAGGDGGKGGDVYLEAVKDIEALRKYIGVKELKAKDGRPGMSRGKHGEAGEDLVIYLPVGSMISYSEKVIDLIKVGERVKILEGGQGGFGNKHFKSSRNVKPDKATDGKPGKCIDLHIELRIIADAGLIGLPNAGKSTLLNKLSNSKAKVGDYPFTTTEPNLGVFNGYVLADIPGLIEGASTGKGLGIKFLKHISRTRLLVHCISSEQENLEKTYSVIRDELARFDENLLKKPEILLLTKTDLISGEELRNKLDELKKINPKATAISQNDPESIKKLEKLLLQQLNTMN
jgi:GTP-binding protein